MKKYNGKLISILSFLTLLLVRPCIAADASLTVMNFSSLKISVYVNTDEGGLNVQNLGDIEPGQPLKHVHIKSGLHPLIDGFEVVIRVDGSDYCSVPVRWGSAGVYVNNNHDCTADK